MTRSLILSSLLSSSFASPRSASFSHSAIVASSHARFRFRLHPASLNPNLTGSPSVSFAKSLSFSTLVTSVAVTSRASSLQRISTAYKSSFQTSAHCFPSFLRFYSSSTLKPISTSSTSVSTMRIIPVPVLKDNYAYIILDEKTSEAAVVDPVEPQKLMHILQHLGAKLTSVLCTHHHMDHAGGNIELISKKPGLAVFGADARIPEINYVVKDKEEFKVGSLTVQALWTHCHTKGSVSYYVKDGNDRAVFTGDTLFLSGCGRFFEGTAADMYNSLLHILATLPVETKVYCGHEYTKANLEFALHVEPDNAHVAQKLQWCSDESVTVTVPGSIGEELLCNPFLRVNEPSLQAVTGKTDPIDVMHVLREMKNKF